MDEAPWVTAMRRHYQQHGFYRATDLVRLLGEPGDSVTTDETGKLVYRRARATQSGEG